MPSKLLTYIEYLRQCTLAASKKRHTKVIARQMHIGHETLRRFLDGETALTVTTVRKVEEWLQRIDTREKQHKL